MEIVDEDQDPVYVEKLRQLLESTKEWGNKVTGFKLEVDQEKFMDTICKLYMEYFQFHGEEAKICALEYEVQLNEYFEYFRNDYLDEKYYQLQTLDDEVSDWVFACRVKSNIEAYNFMFESITGMIEETILEDFLEERREYPDLVGNEIPPNAPKKHWWWHV